MSLFSSFCEYYVVWGRFQNAFEYRFPCIDAFRFVVRRRDYFHALDKRSNPQEEPGFGEILPKTDTWSGTKRHQVLAIWVIGSHDVTVLIQESLGAELVRIRPELGVMMQAVDVDGEVRVLRDLVALDRCGFKVSMGH